MTIHDACLSSAVIVGCGVSGARHHAAARSLFADRTWALDVNMARARALEDTRAVDTLAGLPLEHALVVVATPPGDHLARTREALAQGACVLVEKPLAESAEEVAALCE